MSSKLEIKTGKQIEFERLEYSIVKDALGNLVQDEAVRTYYDCKRWVSVESIKKYLNDDDVYCETLGDFLDELETQ